MSEEEFQDHMMSLWVKGEDTCRPRPRVECADGFHVSVQAGWGKYCSPRSDRGGIRRGDDDYFGPFSAWELGFPSERPTDEIMEHIDGGPETDPTQTVYGYVPTAKVIALIVMHGGFKVEPRNDQHI